MIRSIQRFSARMKAKEHADEIRDKQEHVLGLSGGEIDSDFGVDHV
jgi:hypothetical protein